MFSWSQRVYLRSHFPDTFRQLIGKGTDRFISAVRRSAMDRIVKIDDSDIDCQVQTAAESLRCGHVIAVPTDTIYGVAALAQSSEAVNKLFNVKRRDISKAVAISVGEIDDVYKWGRVTVSRELLGDLLPGPVTLVFDRSPDLNPELNPGTSSVGIRIPDYDFVRKLAQACGEPIALTSANITSEQSPLAIQEFESLWPHLQLVFDGGQLSDSLEARFGSTVVDLTQPGQFKIIRDGSAYKPTVDLLMNKHSLKERR